MERPAFRFILILTLIILGLYFFFTGIVHAKPFLAPLSVAILLSLAVLPATKKLERWGLKRGWAAFISDLLIMAFFAGLFFIVSLQVQNIVQRWPQMKEKIKPKIEQLQRFVAKHTNMSPQEQQQRIQEKIPGGSGSSGSGSSEGGGSGSNSGSGKSSSSGVAGFVGTAVGNFLGFLGTSLLTFIYIFFFIMYRDKFVKSILKFVPEDSQDKAKKIIKETAQVSQDYLVGRLLLILFLAAIYSIGFFISGIQSAILISIIAAVLSLIPYVGNIIGLVLGLAMGLFSGGSSGALIGVVVTFSIAQFVESYILEPYLVGKKVELHPVLTILVVVVGGELWGIVGMVISIPLLGIVKVICDRVPLLHPIGYFLGENGSSDGGDGNIFKKLKNKFTKGNK